VFNVPRIPYVFIWSPSQCLMNSKNYEFSRSLTFCTLTTSFLLDHPYILPSSLFSNTLSLCSLVVTDRISQVSVGWNCPRVSCSLNSCARLVTGHFKTFELKTHTFPPSSCGIGKYIKPSSHIFAVFSVCPDEFKVVWCFKTGGRCPFFHCFLWFTHSL
jgi:hypothetical protein